MTLGNGVPSFLADLEVAHAFCGVPAGMTSRSARWRPVYQVVWADVLASVGDAGGDGAASAGGGTMSNWPVLQTAVGLVFLFATLAVFCSGVCEVLANLLQKRAKYLLAGLHTMLDRPVTGKTAPVFDGKRTPVRSPVAQEPDLSKLAAQPAAAVDAAQAVDRIAKQAADAVPATQDQVQELQPGGLTLALFGHPLLQSLQTNRIGPARRRHRHPSYISAKTFTRVLIDTLVPDAEGNVTLDRVEATVRALPDGLPAKKSLLTHLRRAGNDMAAFEQLVAEWYEEQMGRVSGWYKRWSKVVLGIVGVVVAVVVNVDAIQVAHQLYVKDPVRAAVLNQVNAGTLCQGETDPAKRMSCANDQIASLEAGGLPLWWSAATNPATTGGWALKVLGLLLTGFAISFGAPFWFDALSRIGSLRNTGTKPPPASG
jgi:hypothetical protein